MTYAESVQDETRLKFGQPDVIGRAMIKALVGIASP
jgi:hypothetical protein